MQSDTAQTRSSTIFGLCIALIGLPATVFVYRQVVIDPNATAKILCREVIILLLVAALFWLIAKKERLPLSSIGIGTVGIGRSIIWGLAGTVMLGIGLAACLTVFGLLDIHMGSGGAIAASKWVILLTVIRAGVGEEVFYRGYAIERITALTKSKWVAALVPLIFFAGFHYRQGVAGIVVALVMGGILTGLYLWKRDLVANIIAHFLIDFIPNILLPLISAE